MQLLSIQGTLLADPGFTADLVLGYDVGRRCTVLSTVVCRRAIVTSSSSSVGPHRLPATLADPVLSQSCGGGSNGKLGEKNKSGIRSRASPSSDLLREVVFKGSSGSPQWQP